jgi:hypothetical protein
MIHDRPAQVAWMKVQGHLRAQTLKQASRNRAELPGLAKDKDTLP